MKAKATVRIAFASGPVDGVPIVGSDGPIVLHRRIVGGNLAITADGWTITHRPSGMAFATLNKLAPARRLLSEIRAIKGVDSSNFLTFYRATSRAVPALLKKYKKDLVSDG